MVVTVVMRDNRLPQLLDAAAKRFRDEGYDAASMRDIAADAGMKAGSIYYHFPSKADLLVAVHKEGIRRITDAVERALDGSNEPWPRFEAALVAHLNALLDGGDYAQVVIRELPRKSDPVRRSLIALRDRYEGIFRRLIDDLPLGPSVSRRHLRLMVLGAFNWTQTWYRPPDEMLAEGSGGDAPAVIAGEFIALLRAQL